MNQKSGQSNSGLFRWISNLSIRGRLTLFILMISLIPLIGIAIKDTIQTQQAILQAAEANIRSGALQTTNSLDTFITNTLDGVRVEAQFKDFIEYLSLSPSERIDGSAQEHAKNTLIKLTGKDTVNIISYALVDLNGNILLDSAEANIGKNESTYEYFISALDKNLPTVSAVVYNDLAQTTIFFAGLVRSDSGETLGILRAEYNSSILQQIIIKSASTNKNIRITLLDELNIRIADNERPDLIQKSVVPLSPEQFIVAVNQKRLQGTTAEQQASNLANFDLALKNAKEQSFFTVDINPDESGSDAVAVAFLQTRPWAIAYSQPSSLFLANSQNQIRTNIIFVLLATLLITGLATLLSRTFTLPILHLTETANIVAQGNLNIRAKIESTDEIGSLASTFNLMTDQLQTNLADLEQRISERTLTLERRSIELAIASEVARDINAIRNVDALINQTVGLIRERFNAYHVAIYLIDQRGEYLNLRSASGNAGQLMVENHHRIKINGPGIIAFVSRTGEYYVAEDVENDTTYIKNIILPDTRSEITLPMRSGNNILGVLDIQSTKSKSFSADNATTMQLLADQIVGALENAQLLQRLEATLNELNTARLAQTQAAWQKTSRNRNTNGFEYDGSQTKQLDHLISKDVLMQLQNGKPILLNDTNNQYYQANTLLVPLMVLDQVVGIIGVEQNDPNYEWTEDSINLAQTVATRAALSLENARLLEDSQKRANKEQAISSASNRIGSMQQIENILYTTAEELEKMLGGSEILIQFDNKE